MEKFIDQQLNDKKLNEQQLEAVIEQEISLTKKLHSILKSEKIALTERQPEALQNLVSEKIRILDEIETNHRRNASLSLKNTSGKKQGEFRWENLIQEIPDPKHSLLKKCEEYKSLLEEVEYLNTVNSKIALRMQRSISELIKIIRGNTQAQKLYTPHGSTAASHTYTSIAKA